MSQTHTPHNFSRDEPGILDLCESVYQLDPVSMRRIFLLLTRNHFSDPSFFGNVPDEFKKFRYDDNDRNTTLRVELDYAFDPEEVEQPTSIFVGVSDVNTTKSVLDSFESNNTDNSGKQNVDTDSCAITFSHISKSPDTALKLGVISKGFYQGMRQLLKERLGFRGYTVAKLTAPTKVTEGTTRDYYRVDLSINVVFSSNWTTLIESHRVKRIVVDF